MKFQMFIQNQKIVNEFDKLQNGDTLDEFLISVFQITLDERMAPPKLDKKVMNIALKFLTKKFNLKKTDFDYIGFTDMSFVKQGAKLLQFNITDKKHKSYQSTVAFKYGV